MRSAVKSLTTVTRGFLSLLLLTLSVTQSQGGYSVTYSSTEVCVLTGSTVDITSTYSYPGSVNGHVTTVEKSFWFIKDSDGVFVDLRSDPDYSGRVEYLDGNRKSTLRIKDLRESDSAKYKFRFVTNHDGGRSTGEPGVTVSVTGLQVKVLYTMVYSSSAYAKLRCQSSCRLPDNSTYIWYKNHKFQKEERTYLDSFTYLDTFSCAVKGHERVSSPPLWIFRDKGYSVTYTSTEVCVLRGSTVDITSIYSYPGSVNHRSSSVKESFWFIKGSEVDVRSDPDYSGRVDYLNGKKKSTLRIKDLRESDSAEYKFRFVTNHDGEKFTGEPGVTLSVRDPQLQIEVRRSVGQFSTWTQLTCHSSCQLPDHFSYVWSKNGQRVGGKNYLLFDNISPTDSFDCAIEGHEQIRSPPVYAPRSLSVSVSPSGQIMEGSSVTLTCSSDANPAANYTWYKENITRLHLSEGTQHVLNSIQTSDSGQYQCRVKNLFGTSFNSVTIDVYYAPRSLSVSVSPSGQIMEGSSVTLTCSSDANPAANYTWYKENTVISTGQNLTITEIMTEHGGEYQCEVQNTVGRQNTTTYLVVGGGEVSLALETAFIGISAVILLAVLLVSFVLLIRKKISPGHVVELQEELDNQEASEEQLEPHYASIQLLRTTADPVYSSVMANTSGRHRVLEKLV